MGIGKLRNCCPIELIFDAAATREFGKTFPVWIIFDDCRWITYSCFNRYNSYRLRPEFWGSALMKIIPGFVCYTLYSLASNFMIVNGRAGITFMASLGALVNIVLCITMIPGL
jgi:hypothetical protein